jgi:hypothetical protein
MNIGEEKRIGTAEPVQSPIPVNREEPVQAPEEERVLVPTKQDRW